MKTNQIKLILLLIFYLFISPEFLIAQSQKLQLNEWITNWNLLGPLPLGKSSNELIHLPGFEKDFLSRHGGEQNPKIKTGKTVKVSNVKLKWIDFSSDEIIISLDKAISTKSNVAAYAYKEIFVEKEGAFIVSFGTNDGGRLWINGKEVWDYGVARGCKPDDDQIPVFLKKGINKILLKVEEKGNSWQFCMRILPFNIDVFIEKENLFKVVSLPEGKSELRFSLSESVINYLFRSVQLEITTNEKDPRLVWSGKWTNKRKMELPIPSSIFNKYTLKIIAERQDDEEWIQKIVFQSGKKIDYTLFENQKTYYRIIVGNDASESEQWAANELQKYLKELSGVEFRIDTDDSKFTENEIIIGYNKHSQKLLGEDFGKPKDLDESFFYKNIGSNIVLLGGQKRGTMYAVFSFLENEFGIRWYTPEVTEIPKRESLKFSYLQHEEEPSLQVRNDFYYEAFDPIWAAHNRINGAIEFREQQHGDIEGYWSVHTFYQFMPPSEFFDEYPEYYSLIAGERRYDHAQLCLSNPEVLDIITDRLKTTMKENPSNLIYSVSQNDWGNPCQCDKCQAIVKREGNESGIIVWFVNQIADRIKTEFPDKYVGTLAYQYTRKPPVKIKPKDNVVIRLCSIECCFAHDFESCPENQDFLSDLKEWSFISPQLYIWDYVVNFSHYIMPYPNFNVLQPNIKTFINNSSIGIMEQAAYQSKGGEFAELRSYLIAKLLWNDQADVDEVINDFMAGYYGRSGQYIRKYLDLLHDQITPETHIRLGLEANDKIFSDKFIEAADKIFDKAEVVAENNELLKRVEMARLPLLFLKCKRDPVNSKQDGTYDRFNMIVEREGITHFAEVGKPNIDAFHDQMKRAK